MTNGIPHLENLEQFLFQAPLYAQFLLEGGVEAKELYVWDVNTVKVDGHCPSCGSASIFAVRRQRLPTAHLMNVQRRVARDEISLVCERNERHTIKYYFFINHNVVVKIGQHPSLPTYHWMKFQPIAKA